MLAVLNWPCRCHYCYYYNRFTAPFLGPPGWADARRELLDFMVQGKINTGRHTDHPAGRHSIQTNQCSPPPFPIFYRPDALPAAQPTVSKHWRHCRCHKRSIEFSVWYVKWAVSPSLVCDSVYGMWKEPWLVCDSGARRWWCRRQAARWVSWTW